MGTVDKIKEAERARCPATILAIGTANPASCVYQADYPDFYFRVTKSEHMTALKDKFKRICEKSMIKKRYLQITEEFLQQNPNICTYNARSFNARQDVVTTEVPKLGQEAALKALQEWAQPKSTITHLIFCTSSGVDMPGADYHLSKRLDLPPSVQRIMIYQQGCFAGGTALRIAKDLAENNAGARVLVVCCEITVMLFHGPNEAHLDVLLGQTLFSDGAAAAIVGADPDTENENPLFGLVSASQTIIPGSDGAIMGQLREMGFMYYLSEKAPRLIGDNIEKCLVEGLGSIGPLGSVGLSDWNSLFYIVHPGGPAFLNQIESKLGLKEEKLEMSRHVLREFGNMGAPCVLFIMDQMRKKAMAEGKSTTGDGLDLGVLVGLGPGLTVETIVLQSMPIVAAH